MVSAPTWLGERAAGTGAADIDIEDLVTARTSQCGAGSPDAGGAQEWRDAQWTPNKLRHMDELDLEGGGTNKPRWRQVLQVTRSIRERK